MLAKIANGLRFLLAYATVVRDPTRLDRIFALIDGSKGIDDHDEIAARLLARPEIAAFVGSDPGLFTPDIHTLRALAPGSLGRAFADFLDARGLELESLHRHDPPTTALEHVHVHLEYSHDLWHVLTGFDTDVAGELGLQAFYLAQLGMPPPAVILSAGLLNAVLEDPEDLSRRMQAIATGWHYGRSVGLLVGTDWTPLLATPLEQVRASFGIDTQWVERAAMLEPQVRVVAA